MARLLSPLVLRRSEPLGRVSAQAASLGLTRTGSAMAKGPVSRDHRPSCCQQLGLTPSLSSSEDVIRLPTVWR